MKIILELDLEQALMIRDGVELLQPDTDEDADRQEELLQFLNGAINQPNDKYPVSDWQYQVANGDTWLGYSHWVKSQVEMNQGDDR